MLFSELKKNLNCQVQNVYYIEGDDVFFRMRAKEMIKNKCVSEPELNLSIFEGAKIKNELKTFLSALDSLPFMSEYRVVVVNEWYPTVADLKVKELKAFFENPSPTTVLVIDNEKKCEQLKKIKSIVLVDCKKGDTELISAYIMAETKKAGISVSREAIDKIIDYSQYDMSKIACETAKLISYANDKKTIEVIDVDELVEKTTDYKIYEMVEFIAKKNFLKAYEILGDIMENSDRQILLASLYYHFRRMLHSSITTLSRDEVAALLDVKPFAVQKAQEQAKYFTPKRLMKITKKLALVDSQFKSGEIALDSGLSEAVFEILTEK